MSAESDTEFHARCAALMGNVTPAQVAEMVAEIAELRRDKARLDFICEGHRGVVYSERVQQFLVQTNQQVVGNCGHATKLRDAIDAAMEGSK